MIFRFLYMGVLKEDYAGQDFAIYPNQFIYEYIWLGKIFVSIYASIQH
jgi:hypothetical protein